MINFPVAGGTSGHLLGGALAAIVLGPWAGILAMTAVVGVQALLFQDGGRLALGANIFNMGILTALLGYGIYAGFAGRSRKVRLAAAGFAAWISVVGGALATAIQLWMSGTAALGVVMPVMLGVHALIGIGEALVTMAALSYIFSARPAAIAESRDRHRRWTVLGIGAALVILLLAPFASLNPDGLERVAADLGFAAVAHRVDFGLLPGYLVPGLGNGGVSTIVAGLIGLLLVLGVGLALSRLVRRRAASGR